MEIANLVNDEDYYRLRARLFGEDFPSFMNELPVSLLHEIDEKVGPDRIFILKTHCDLSDGVAELLSQGKIKAFTSFRDPRDTALSTLNAGKKDREKGNSRWFSNFDQIQQLRTHIDRQADKVRDWIAHPQVLSIPYYLTAMSQSTSVGLLADHLGVPYLKDILAAEMDARREKLPEFNKGVLDRFVDELSVDDLIYANKAWAYAILRYDSVLERVMARQGHRLAHGYFTALRDEKLQERLAQA